MTKRIAIAAAVGVVLAACGSTDKCPTESPQLSAVGNCTARPGTTVSYPVRLCPTCNQTGATCDVQMAGTDIFLNPTVEACSSSTSCGPATCETNPFSCTFTAPTVPDTYTVTVVNGTGGVVSRTLTVSTSDPVACDLQPI